jgi:hypothetical protein
MGKCFLCKSGGGGGGGSKIVVTVEAGSVVTCTDGKTTKTTVSNGTVVFSGLSIGWWTITATKDSRTAQQIVEVAYPSISMAYELTLYDMGDITEASGGFAMKTYSGTSLTESTYNGVVNVRASSSSSSGVYLTNNAIDVSGFKKLQYKCGRGGEGNLNVVLMPVGATSVDDAVASKEITIFESKPTVLEEMDISAITGQYQVGASLKGTSGYLNFYMAYMHLE